MDRQRQRLFLILLLVFANSAPGAGEPAKLDRHGDPLPDGAITRLGTTRLCHKGEVLALAFSADNSVLVTSGLDDTVCVWQVSGGKKQLELKARDYKLNILRSVAISPDGKLLATVASGGSDEVTIHAWNVANGEEKFKKTYTNGSSAIAFSPDSKLLALAGAPIVLLDSNTGRQVRTFEEHKSIASGIQFSGDGKVVASLHQNGTILQFWLSATGKPLFEIKAPENDSFRCLAFAPDNKRIATRSREGTVWLWDIASTRPVQHFEAHKGAILSVTYSANGELLATASAPGGVALWDPRTGKQQRSFIGDRNGRYFGSADTIASISPDGKYLASANGHAIRLWDVTTGRECADLARHPLAVRTCTFSADGMEVWTSCGEPIYPRGDHVLRCWDTASGKLTRQIDLPEQEWIFAVSDDAKLALTGVDGRGDVVHLWNADSRKQLHALGGHRYGVTRAVSRETAST